MNKKYLPLLLLVAIVVIIVAAFSGKNRSVAKEYQSTNVAGLAEAVPAQTVELKDGDSYDLTASYVKKNIGGTEYRMLAYNRSIPGPTIKVPQNATVTVNFKNLTDMPALLHSHGVRMANAFDGAQTSQKEIAPGKKFSYTLTFPDTGVFWYHPHVEEVLGQALGQYGAFIVTSSDQSYFPPVNQEVPLFLSDLPIENGQIALSKDDADHALMGHYGTMFLTNGSDAYSLSVKKGVVVRLDVVNAANARPFNFAIEGTKLKIVGGDNGGYEKAFYADSVTLGPSERAIIDVYFPKSGTFKMENKTPDGTNTLGTVTVSLEAIDHSYTPEWNTLQENTTVEKSIDPFRAYFNAAPDKNLKLSVSMNMGSMNHGMHMMPDGTMMGGMGATMQMGASDDGIEWNNTNSMMDQMTADSVKWQIIDTDTGKINGDIDWTLKKDQPVKIRIYNDPNSMHPMQHPIHFHGQRFLVVSRNGVPQKNLVWKDTTLVKLGETVDIILDTSNLGTWMAHCHTAEHLAGGMMFMFKVQ